MENKIEILTRALQKPLRYLRRDFSEIQNLQGNDATIDKFTAQSLKKASKDITDNLSKYYQQICFDEQAIKEANSAQSCIFIHLIDGLTNFKRGLPSFGIPICELIYKDGKWQPQMLMLNLPATGEVAWAELGRGAWHIKNDEYTQRSSRLRSVNCHKAKEALILSQQKYFAKDLPNPMRILGSAAYSFYALAAGRADACLFSVPHHYGLALQMFCQEAGLIATFEQGKLLAHSANLQNKLEL